MHHYKAALIAGTVEYTDWISAEEKDSHNECPNMTINHLMVKVYSIFPGELASDRVLSMDQIDLFDF